MAEETTETQKPQITGSVRIGKDVYKAGMEEKLAKKATAKQLEHLASQGVISGDWPIQKKAPVETAPTGGSEPKEPPTGKEK
jgi:hypothetical protein